MNRNVVRLFVSGLFVVLLSSCVTNRTLEKSTVRYFEPVSQIPPGYAVVYFYRVDRNKHKYIVRGRQYDGRWSQKIRWLKPGMDVSKYNSKAVMRKLFYLNSGYYYAYLIPVGNTAFRATRYSRQVDQFVMRGWSRLMHRTGHVYFKAQDGLAYFIVGEASGRRMRLHLVENRKAVKDIVDAKLQLSNW